MARTEMQQNLLITHYSKGFGWGKLVFKLSQLSTCLPVLLMCIPLGCPSPRPCHNLPKFIPQELLCQFLWVWVFFPSNTQVSSPISRLQSMAYVAGIECLHRSTAFSPMAVPLGIRGNHPHGNFPVRNQGIKPHDKNRPDKVTSFL